MIRWYGSGDGDHAPVDIYMYYNFGGHEVSHEDHRVRFRMMKVGLRSVDDIVD